MEKIIREVENKPFFIDEFFSKYNLYHIQKTKGKEYIEMNISSFKDKIRKLKVRGVDINSFTFKPLKRGTASRRGSEFKHLHKSTTIIYRDKDDVLAYRMMISKLKLKHDYYNLIGIPMLGKKVKHRKDGVNKRGIE